VPLDGLRAWIGEVERKLGIRTRVFLVLATIAIGGAGASIYLAIDTRDNAVSESDVQTLQSELEGRTGGTGVGATGTAATKVPQLEAELKALQAQVRELQGEGGASSGENQGGSNDEVGGASKSPETGTSGSSGPTKEALKDLLRQAKEQQEK
jgi:hypothetical protein